MRQGKGGLQRTEKAGIKEEKLQEKKKMRRPIIAGRGQNDSSHGKRVELPECLCKRQEPVV